MCELIMSGIIEFGHRKSVIQNLSYLALIFCPAGYLCITKIEGNCDSITSRPFLLTPYAVSGNIILFFNHVDTWLHIILLTIIPICVLF